MSISTSPIKVKGFNSLLVKKQKLSDSEMIKIYLDNLANPNYTSPDTKKHISNKVQCRRTNGLSIKKTSSVRGGLMHKDKLSQLRFGILKKGYSKNGLMREGRGSLIKKTSSIREREFNFIMPSVYKPFKEAKEGIIGGKERQKMIKGKQYV